VFPRWYGHGEGTFIWQFVKVLRGQQMAVKVVAMHSPGLATHEIWEGVEIVRPPYWWPSGAEMLRKDGGGLPINFRRYPLARVQLPVLLGAHAAAITRAAEDCDLIHAHFTVATAAALAARLRRHVPVVATVHGSDIFQVPKLPLGAAFTRGTLRRTAAVTTVSSALRDACLALDVPAAQVRVISNSVDTALYAPPPDDTFARRDPLVLFVGSLIARKGVATLLRAFAEITPALRRQGAAYRLLLIGDGPEEAGLAALAVELGIGDFVEFGGFLPQADVAAAMRRARLFVLPSNEEGQGVVLLEAMASGAPVVATDVGGIPEVMGELVARGLGRLAPPGDPPALAAHMRAVLDDPAHWQELSLAGRRHVEQHFSPGAIGVCYRDLYAELLARKR
jgi:glycosyltransferase involved in cell wall biosynthesis